MSTGIDLCYLKILHVQKIHFEIKIDEMKLY